MLRWPQACFGGAAAGRLLPLLVALLLAPATLADLNYTRSSSGFLYILASTPGNMTYHDASRYCDDTYGMTLVTYADNNEQTDVEAFFASSLGTSSYWTGLLLPHGAGSLPERLCTHPGVFVRLQPLPPATHHAGRSELFTAGADARPSACRLNLV